MLLKKAKLLSSFTIIISYFFYLLSSIFFPFHVYATQESHLDTINIPDTPYKSINTKSKKSSVSIDVRNQVAPYLLPDYHPLKIQLDKIFKKSRATANLRSLEKAGFNKTKPQPWTKVVVTKHKSIPGFVFKMYLDDQRYHQGQPEHVYWIKRINGANLIRNEVNAMSWQAFFKVPQKWIYALPSKPKGAKGHYPAKHFILVEEDMNIVDEETNKNIWQSGLVGTTHLDMLFHILNTLGLGDCTKPANIPFSYDGKIAFVDTQSYHTGFIDPARLIAILPPHLGQYCLLLVQQYVASVMNIQIAQ